MAKRKCLWYFSTWPWSSGEVAIMWALSNPLFQPTILSLIGEKDIEIGILKISLWNSMGACLYFNYCIGNHNRRTSNCMVRKRNTCIQQRIGPKYAGPLQVLQDLVDGTKRLFLKNLLPSRGDTHLFSIGPSIHSTHIHFTKLFINSFWLSPWFRRSAYRCFFYGLPFQVLLPSDFLCHDMDRIRNIPF